MKAVFEASDANKQRENATGEQQNEQGDGGEQQRSAQKHHAAEHVSGDEESVEGVEIEPYLPIMIGIKADMGDVTPRHWALIVDGGHEQGVQQFDDVEHDMEHDDVGHDEQTDACQPVFEHAYGGGEHVDATRFELAVAEKLRGGHNHHNRIDERCPTTDDAGHVDYLIVGERFVVVMAASEEESSEHHHEQHTESDARRDVELAAMFHPQLFEIAPKTVPSEEIVSHDEPPFLWLLQ